MEKLAELLVDNRPAGVTIADKKKEFASVPLNAEHLPGALDSTFKSNLPAALRNGIKYLKTFFWLKLCRKEKAEAV